MKSIDQKLKYFIRKKYVKNTQIFRLWPNQVNFDWKLEFLYFFLIKKQSKYLLQKYLLFHDYNYESQIFLKISHEIEDA